MSLVPASSAHKRKTALSHFNKSSNKSGFFGVEYVEKSGKYRAVLSHLGVKYRGQNRSTNYDAKEDYDQLYIKLIGGAVPLGGAL